MEPNELKTHDEYLKEAWERLMHEGRPDLARELREANPVLDDLVDGIAWAQEAALEAKNTLVQAGFDVGLYHSVYQDSEGYITYEYSVAMIFKPPVRTPEGD